jgi:TolB protein
MRTASMTVVIAAALLFTSACATKHDDPARSASPSTPAPSSTTTDAATTGPATTASSSPPQVGITTASGPKVTGVGTLYYYSETDSGLELVRLGSAGASALVHFSSYSFTAVSPDGKHLAILDQDGGLRVTELNGKPVREFGTGYNGVGYEPSWAPGGDRILVSKDNVYGTVPAGGGAFSALAHPISGIHAMFSGDGKKIVYATGTCDIMIANADGSDAHRVPANSANPDGWRSCDPYGVSKDGTNVALNVALKGQELGDIGPGYTADYILNTSTGRLSKPAVSGTVTQIVYRGDGNLLIRSTHNNTTTITLQTPGGTTLTSTTEAASLANTTLLTNTPT